MSSRELKAHCELDEATHDLLKLAMTEYNLSARAYDRILKVARTIIADLAGAERINCDHIGEAIQYRSLDRQLWGKLALSASYSSGQTQADLLYCALRSR